MAAGVQVAQGYVVITPSMEGAQKAIESELGKAAERAADSAGKRAGKKLGEGIKGGAKPEAFKGYETGFSRIMTKSAQLTQLRMASAFASVRERASAAFSAVSGSVKQVGSNIAQSLGGTKVGQAVMSMADGAKGAVARVAGTVKGLASAVGEAVPGAVKAAGSAIKGVFSTVAQAAGPALSKVGELAGRAFDKLKTAAKAGAVAATAALVAIGKGSLDAYASYEQLSGGVAKLFGAGPAKSVEEYAASVGKSVSDVQGTYDGLKRAEAAVAENAQNAYRTAGLSANDYMQTVTSFSASLISSLGGDTEEAAKVADVAMVSMADNVNTFGSNMEDVQNAYQGFAKQNYTMLDNLKLGYGGTKSEMERLIADANEYGASIGEASDLSVDSFADIVRAIDLVQQKQGIAGTTAREAATTIEGSMAMTKAAWANLLTEFGKDDGNVGQRVQELVSSASTLLVGAFDENGERISTGIVGRLGTIFQNVAANMPQIMATLGQAMGAVGETVVQTIDGVTGGMATRALSFLEPIRTQLSGALLSLQRPVASLSLAFQDFAGAALPVVRDAVAGLVPVLAQIGSVVMGTVAAALRTLTDVVTSNGPALQAMGAAVSQVATTLVGFLGGALQAVMPVIGSLASAVLPVLAGAWTLVSGAVSALTGFVGGFVSALAGHLGPAIDALSPTLDALGGALGAVGDFVGANVTPVMTALGDVLGGIVGGAIQFVAEKFAALMDFLAPVGEFFGGIAQGIGDAWNSLTGQTQTSMDQTKQSVSTSMQSVATDTASSAQQAASSMGASWDQIRADAESAFKDVSKSAESGTQSVVSKTKDSMGKVGTQLSQALNTTTSAGVDTGAMTEKATQMVNTAVEAAKSVDASEVGKAFAESAASGIDTSAMSAKAAELASGASAISQTATVAVKADLSGVSQIRSGAAQVSSAVSSMRGSVASAMAGVTGAVNSAGGSFRSFASSVSSSMAGAARAAQSAAGTIRAATNIPNKTVRIDVAAGSVKLPHFSMRGKFDPESGAVPSVSVSWWKNGGIFPARRPTVIGVGDARVPEAVTPIDKLQGMIDESVGQKPSQVKYEINITSQDDPDAIARRVTQALRAHELTHGRS